MALSYPLDRISFEIGMINCFIEMVACGVKQLAISPPILPENLALMETASREISEGFGTKYTVVESLILTDIQSAEFTEGKNSILYYQEDAVIERYFELAAKIEALRLKNAYHGAARRDISIEFGRMLGYPEAVILRKVDGAERETPFVLE